ncbi:MAG TPA: hypothetical protein VJJ51_11025 [Candidatus Methanoperedens sp.]|nr:hypothetical protein [Candidatus Methanoperedens sp.]HLB71564.1 hypothetical protein [Candidatus Methanoperedens sp.]
MMAKIQKDEEHIMSKRKKIINLLNEAAIAGVSKKEMKKERAALEKELLDR